MLLAFVCRTRNETGVSGHGGSEMDSKAITPASNTNLAPGAVPLVNWREAPDTDVPDRLSPSTVNLKLIGLRQFLRFCMVTGIARATVEKPYRVLNEGERRRLLAAARKRGPREYALITLALGTIPVNESLCW
jgi:integrase